MEQKVNEYTITAFSENAVGLLNRITIIFTRRHINIESLTVSASAIKGVHKFTIVVNTTEAMIIKVTRQIERLVEVLKAYYHTDEEIVHQEMALYKVPAHILTENDAMEKIYRKYGASLISMTDQFAVIQMTGHREETQELFARLEPYGVLQFTRSGRIAVNKDTRELLSEYLDQWEAEQD